MHVKKLSVARARQYSDISMCLLFFSIAKARPVGNCRERSGQEAVELLDDDDDAEDEDAREEMRLPGWPPMITSNSQNLSDAKCKELSGHDIFAPPPEILPRPLAARALDTNQDMGEPALRHVRTSVKVSNPAGGQSTIISNEEPVMKTAKKIYDKKFSELSGNNVFKGDAPPTSAEKSLSSAKMREISGNDIFADGKAESRDYFGGVRKPPGGESSIALV
ncbi:uncharacterized protein LOC130138211 [Syzygium oleosum]|uniref:uncharacterized protein LOC130138211 n=1 Tax=Syzygium oleosum TaxID=219896 RepID=UPI0024BB4AC4|nr:uncharacterized protein LOC130138211 [Syzygium oleosum]